LIIDAALLERVLERDEVLPCFQPLRELRSGRLIGFELLARWNHAELGLILPETFIEVAEECGLLKELTKRVLQKAFQTAIDMPESLRLAVNVSPSQMKDVTLPEQIATIAGETNFPLDRLTVEVTETSLLLNFDVARDVTREFKAMGCKLVLDDFGTGYSNLRHLQMVDFDGLKIDKSFVTEITRSRDSRKIVASLIGLGQSLGLTTVAEGLEYEEQASLLLYLGCDIGQGWYYGRPVMASQLTDVINSVPAKLNAKWSVAASDLASMEALPVQRVAHLQAIYDGAPVGLCLLSRDFRYVSVNRRFAEMKRMQPSDMIGQTVYGLFPGWFPLYEPYLNRVLAGEVLSDIEISRPALMENDIGPTTILVSYEPAKDEAGEVMGISMAVLDITERKRNEEALRRSEEQYRNLIDLNPQTPWIFDAHANLIDFGSHWEKLTGFTRKEILQMGYVNTICEEDRDRVARAMVDSFANKTDLDIEWRAKMKTGSLCWMRSRGTIIVEASGDTYRLYGSTEDINELVGLRRFKERASLAQEKG
jgi:PAS domain S-box-containing protein